PSGLLFFRCRDFFDGFPDGATLGAYALSLVLAFLIGFFFEATIGMIGFWFLEVSSFLYIINTISFFVSGQMFPLDLLPPFWSGLLRSLPFQYLAYFPASVFLGKIQGDALVHGLLMELTWAAVFIGLANVLYRRGRGRSSGLGGCALRGMGG